MEDNFLKPEDYGKLVIEGLLLPERMVKDYYLYKIKKYHTDNPNILEELRSVVLGLIEWYKGRARGGAVEAEMPDGTIQIFDRNQTWESDGDGDYTKWVKHDLYEHEIFLLPLTSEKNVKVNKAYLENHLSIIEGIASEIKLQNIEVVMDFLNGSIKKLEKKKKDTGKETIPFRDIFKTEYRKRIPDDVIELLGPGQADAWELIRGQKKWTYNKPESAIIIPFYLLVKKGFINIDSRCKKLFISSWLKEFGIKYKAKTFDKQPKDYKAVEHFTDYIDRIN
jgi:hypothetical protein